VQLAQGGDEARNVRSIVGVVDRADDGIKQPACALDVPGVAARQRQVRERLADALEVRQGLGDGEGFLGQLARETDLARQQRLVVEIVERERGEVPVPAANAAFITIAQ
jgi:hypothetical protein